MTAPEAWRMRCTSGRRSPAQGMVQVQLDVSTDEAMLRIQVHALAAGLSITEVATDIVSGRLRPDREND